MKKYLVPIMLYVAVFQVGLGRGNSYYLIPLRDFSESRIIATKKKIHDIMLVDADARVKILTRDGESVGELCKAIDLVKKLGIRKILFGSDIEHAFEVEKIELLEQGRERVGKEDW